MQVLYSLGQEDALLEPLGPEALTLRQRGVARIGLLDDQYLAGRAADVIAAWPHVVASLEVAGHTLGLHKVRAYAPAQQGVPDHELPRDLQELFAIVPRAHEGLPLFGSAANGDSQVIVTPDNVVAGPARKRAAKAVTLAGRIPIAHRHR